MGSVWRDLRYAVRMLARNKGFTAVAVLSLALGIGANTAIFTLTNAVFLNPLPIPEARRVLELYTVDHATANTGAGFLASPRTQMSFLNYKDIRTRNNVFSDVAAFTFPNVTLTGRGDPKPQPAFLVSANYFDVLGVKPALGRTFFPNEDQAEGGNTVAVLSYSLWQNLFGGDREAIGKTVEFNSVPYTVIGVMPPEFKGTLTFGAADVAWLPISMHAQTLAGPLEQLLMERRMRMISVFGRLKPGVAEGQAAEQLRAIAAGLEREYPRANNGRAIEESSLAEGALAFLPRAQLDTGSIALSAVVGLVLLIACINIANLLLARSNRRMREMGIRTALGAERGRLVQQLLTESLLISLAGGVVGLLIGTLGSDLLWSFRPPFFPVNSLKIGLDWRVFGFTAAITVATGIIFGVVPALRTSVTQLSEVLKTGGRGGNEGASRSGLRNLLVIGEVSLALVALTGAGLLIRSMQRVQAINPGFETHNLFVVNFDVGPQKLAPEAGRAFLRTVMDRAKSVPGVKSVALASNRPLAGGILATILPEGAENDPAQRGLLALIDVVSAEYFDTVRIPIVQGRGFSGFDREGSRPVAVISEAMARHFWPGQNVLGKRFRYATGGPYREVIGVSANAVTVTIGEQPQPVVFVPLDQQYQSAVSLQVLTSGNPGSVMPGVLRAVQSLNSNMALANPNTIEDLMRQGLWGPRVAAGLFGVFGLLGLLLASVGIYGVMAYLVAQRTNEIGLRMALGARPWDVLQLVVGHGLRLTVVGVVVGLAGSLAVTRLLGSLLLEVPAYDPVTFAAVGLLVAGISFLAGWLPARRASRIDPVIALRQD